MLNRRRFLACLAALPVVPLTGGATTAIVTRHYFLNRFSIANIRSAAMDFIQQQPCPLRQGATLRLSADPADPFDPYTVHIVHEKLTLGRVPSGDNRHISRLLDQGAVLTCRVRDVAPAEAPWNMVGVGNIASRLRDSGFGNPSANLAQGGFDDAI